METMSGFMLLTFWLCAGVNYIMLRNMSKRQKGLLEQPSVGIEHVVQRMDACGDVLFQILRCIGWTGSELLDPDRDRNAPAFGRTGVEILLDTRYGAQQTEERKR